MATADETPTRLLLVRHGESEVTVRRVIGGSRTCSGLSRLGRRQAEALRDRLVAHPVEVDVFVSSDYERAIETAAILQPALDRTESGFARLPGWGEHDPGPEIDGMSFTQYVERYGTPDWGGDPDTVIFPGGETPREFHRRVHDALEELVTAHTGRSIMVSCHGGVVDVVFRKLLGFSMTGGFELHTLNTSITEFELSSSGAWRLTRYNDAAHLAGLPAATPRTPDTAPSSSDRGVTSADRPQ